MDEILHELIENLIYELQRDVSSMRANSYVEELLEQIQERMRELE